MTPDDRPSERMTVEDDLAEVVVDQFGRRVLVHGDLFQHDLPLLIEVGEARSRHDLGDDLERGLEIVVEQACIDERVLLGGGRVGLRPEIVEDLRDLPCGVPGRPLEDEMLDEVRDAAEPGWLQSGAGRDPEYERHRAHALEALGGHSQAVVQR